MSRNPPASSPQPPPSIRYSSALSQEQRTAIIDGMRQGGVSVLVCSDAFARGMDFADVQVPKRVPPPQKTGSHCNAFA